MVATPLPIVALIKAAQPLNAKSPMLPTPFPIATLVRCERAEGSHSDTGDAVGDHNAIQRSAVIERVIPILLTPSGTV